LLDRVISFIQSEWDRDFKRLANAALGIKDVIAQAFSRFFRWAVDAASIAATQWQQAMVVSEDAIQQAERDDNAADR
jgi:hypothetical protein